MGEMTEAEARYIQRLPDQLMGALRKVQHYQSAHNRYGMCLDDEAQRLLEQIYGRSGARWEIGDDGELCAVEAEPAPAFDPLLAALRRSYPERCAA